jgi:malate dehydrogenase
MIPADRLAAIAQRTRDGGAEIVKLLKTGSAYYAPAAAVAEMVESIVKDKKKILPCAVLCTGQYGIPSLFVGVPAVLGRRGVEKILEINLSGDEKAQLEKSVAAVKELCEAVDKLMVPA